MMESQDFNNPTSFSNVPAGFWIRFVAMLIDSIIVGVGYGILMFAMIAIEMYAMAMILGFIPLCKQRSSITVSYTPTNVPNVPEIKCNSS